MDNLSTELRELLIEMKHTSRVVRHEQTGETLVEAGESRTLRTTTDTVPNNTLNSPYLSTSSVLESNHQQVRDPAEFQSDPTKLLTQLLDQLTALGETARQLRHTLGDDGHRPEKIAEVIKQLTEGGDHAH